MKNNIKDIAPQLSKCGNFDLEFLGELMKTYNLDVYIEDILAHGNEDDNITFLIYEAYKQIKDMFLKENQDEIKTLGFNPKDLEEDFEIYTSYNLGFNNRNVETIYQKWRKH